MNLKKLDAIQVSPIALGQLLVAGGFITNDTLQKALRVQRGSHRRLGEVLVQHRALNDVEKRATLKLQEKLSSQTLALKPDGSMTQTLQLSLGQLLLSSGEITHSQLDLALAEHSRQNRRLGEVLVDQQLLTLSGLAHWLQLQKKLISAAAIATWMMTASCNVAADDKQQSLWEKFISENLSQEKPSNSQQTWGQQGSKSLTKLNIQNRDLNELKRSRDGSLTLKFGHQGLNIIKRF